MLLLLQSVPDSRGKAGALPANILRDARRSRRWSPVAHHHPDYRDNGRDDCDREEVERVDVVDHPESPTRFQSCCRVTALSAGRIFLFRRSYANRRNCAFQRAAATSTPAPAAIRCDGRLDAPRLQGPGDPGQRHDPRARPSCCRRGRSPPMAPRKAAFYMLVLFTLPVC